MNRKSRISLFLTWTLEIFSLNEIVCCDVVTQIRNAVRSPHPARVRAEEGWDQCGVSAGANTRTISQLIIISQSSLGLPSTLYQGEIRKNDLISHISYLISHISYLISGLPAPHHWVGVVTASCQMETFGKVCQPWAGSKFPVESQV